MTYQLIGLTLFAFGFIHILELPSRVDKRLVLSIQGALGRNPYLKWFKEIWFFGRTSFALVILLLLTGFDWRLGAVALGIFGITAGLERAIKVFMDRSRPFRVHQEVESLQPLEPLDPSFPSGDALRIWFLVLILSSAMGNSLFLGILSITLAGLVSLGRIVFGVHYFTDVLAGAGLGLLGGGLTIWLWHSMHLL